MKSPIEGFSGIHELDSWYGLPQKERQPREDLYESALFSMRQLGWVSKVENVWPGLILEGFLGVFLFEITSRQKDVPRFHWVITGPIWPDTQLYQMPDAEIFIPEDYRGLPCAYIWTGYPDFDEEGDAPTPREALEPYCITMEDWVEAVRMQGNPADVYPVCVPPGMPPTKYADSVEEHIKVLRAYIA